MEQLLEISQEVQESIQNNLPVVALETTLISFGLPYPENYQTGLEMERIIRESGAIPATIGVVDGKVKVGLSCDEIKRFATDSAVTKVSVRDMPYALSQNLLGATTIASTMMIAEKVNIKVFATGGLGGVHRKVEETWDISADLIEISNRSVTVVSSGAKSILDLPKTIEYLETLSVPVIGYQTDKFASFYSRESGVLANYRLDSVNEIAALMKTKWELALHGGLLIANPVPADQEIPYDVINFYIEEAVQSAHEEGVKGKDITPYLLKKINELTKGESLQTNMALVKSNAKVGAEIAIAYQQLINKDS
ncbi:pseudouridine-5'-phosphate glycosidase [Oceanobacillus neutriphilus]|uniref:Pseudouridine-5'-phosphate glycosidase n=1 Tax=Oceanobacillus neutriphilus TaxID=531815 RepID=A0ABQ2NWU6_9BACI|nr:pseudouridine-5'-phosphate glycosidase [Oceanobacillus neutriphilus]GGP12606.1 pseudouridine-5'-phosphate glycosidase [Oceanobacillus neutriphilus]